MKVIPVQGAGQVQDKSTPESVRTAKAVNAFKQASAQVPVPVNANAVSVEELGAVRAQQAETIVENTELESAFTEDQVEQTQSEAPVKAKPQQDPAVKRQFEQLARQERQMRQKAAQDQQKLKAEREAFEAEKQAFQSKSKTYSEGFVSLEDFKADPFGVMERTGLTYDELTQRALNQQPKDPRVEATISRLEAKIRALEESSETNQKSYQQQQQDSYNQAVKQIELDARSLVKSDPVAFEAISKTGSIRDVVELITETYNKDGVLLTVEEAANEVENYLVDEGYKTVSTIDKIKKRMTANAQTASNSKAAGTASNQKQSQPMKTLTNAVGSTRQLSVRERAIAAMEGRLK
jgi:hypothetical protein